jgi:Outer membrane protein beta-barrel domain
MVLLHKESTMMSPFRMSRWLLLLGAPVVALPRLAVAQHGHAEPLTIHVTSVTSAQLVSSIAGVRQDLGAILATVPHVVPADAINVGKGKRLDVLVDHPVLDTATINDVIVLSDGSDPECGNMQSGVVQQITNQPARRSCQKLGTLTWGETSDLFLARSTSGNWSMKTRTVPRTLTLGAQVSYNQFNKLENIGCDPTANPGMTSCGASSNKVGFDLFAEYHVGNVLRVGATYGHTTYQVHQMYGGTTLDHNVRVQSYGGYLQVRHGWGMLTPYGVVGLNYLDNSSDILQGTDILGHHSESGWRKGCGAGLDWGVSPRVGWRVGVGYQWGGGGDADSHLRYVTGLTLTF